MTQCTTFTTCVPRASVSIIGHNQESMGDLVLCVIIACCGLSQRGSRKHICVQSIELVMNGIIESC